MYTLIMGHVAEVGLENRGWILSRCLGTASNAKRATTAVATMVHRRRETAASERVEWYSCFVISSVPLLPPYSAMRQSDSMRNIPFLFTSSCLVGFRWTTYVKLSSF